MFTRRTTLLFTVGAVLALGGGIAYATVPGGADAIHGCYQKQSGSLRVIDPATDTCNPSETAISWNAQGVPGPRGDPGSAGPAGPAGSAIATRIRTSEPVKVDGGSYVTLPL